MAPTATSTNATPTAQYGRLLIDVTDYQTHRALRVYAGADEIPALAYATASDADFAARYWLIANAATANVNSDDIARLVEQDIAEAELVKAELDGDLQRVAQLRAHIPTLMTAEQKALAARFAASVDVIAEIKAGNDASDRQQVSKRTFADLNLGGHNAYLARRNQKVNFDDPTPAQLALLRECASNPTHFVPVGDGNDERTIRAAASKLLGTLVYRMQGKRQKLIGFRATARGLKWVTQ